ncbi:hypothetical protein RIF29_00135 [Crotalaria pallida]|uniref:Non-specific lipid-transfer protein n=1 Tax=Crotalaria pallida TaxID=3830 RepID=A0AAN9IVE2_CROPI
MCLVLISVNSSPKAQAVVTCGQVIGNLAPCVSYIRNGGRYVPQQCCNGIRTLSGLARSTADRQSVCNCIKNSVRGIPFTSFNLNLANGIAQRCGVSTNYKLNPSIDCSR